MDDKTGSTEPQGAQRDQAGKRRGRPRKRFEDDMCDRTVKRRAHEDMKGWFPKLEQDNISSAGECSTAKLSPTHTSPNEDDFNFLDVNVLDSLESFSEPNEEVLSISQESNLCSLSDRGDSSVANAGCGDVGARIVLPSTSREGEDVMSVVSESEWYDADEMYFTFDVQCDCGIYCVCTTCDVCHHEENGECMHCSMCLEEANASSCSGDDENDYSSDSSDEGEENVVVVSNEECRNNDMKKDLLRIFLSHNASHLLIDDLLNFFAKFNIGNMPKSAKTLLKTPVAINIRPMPPGEYWHCGLEHHVMQFITDTNCSKVDITFSVDGIPLTKSSGSDFWSVTVCFNSSPDVRLVGVYHGSSKPADANDFMKEFLDEVIPMCDNGINFDGRTVPVNVVCGIFDAPAKSFVLCTKGHSGYFSCSKCCEEGEMFGRRIAFPELNAPLRTDESFKMLQDEEYHHRESDIVKIPRFGPVSCIPVEYLHLMLLGIMRKQLYLWLKGPLRVRQGSSVMNGISNAFVSFVGWVPREFARKPRSLEFLKRFKATEFRQILLYTGPVAFRKLLPKTHYEHFLVLHVLATIFVSPIFCKQYLQYGRELCFYYVKTFIALVGVEFVSHNIHSLIHLPDDVQKYGNLDNFSAFKFENFYHKLKKVLRKSNKPLAQLARRFGECQAAQESFLKDKSNRCDKEAANGQAQFSAQHRRGPVLKDCTNAQYSCCLLPTGQKVTLSEADCCCVLKSGTVILARNFSANQNGEKVVIGYNFMVYEDLYDVPCPSSTFDIRHVKRLSPHLKCWKVLDIKGSYNYKYFVVDFCDGPQIVPRNWLDPTLETCAWPPFAHECDQMQYDRLVRNMTPVELDWTDTNVERIRAFGDSFSYVRKKLKEAEDFSETDLNSAPEVPDNRDQLRTSRRRRCSRRARNDDSESIEVSTKLKIPALPSLRSATSQSKPAPNPATQGPSYSGSNVGNLNTIQKNCRKGGGSLTPFPQKSNLNEESEKSGDGPQLGKDCEDREKKSKTHEKAQPESNTVQLSCSSEKRGHAEESNSNQLLSQGFEKKKNKNEDQEAEAFGRPQLSKGFEGNIQKIEQQGKAEPKSNGVLLSCVADKVKEAGDCDRPHQRKKSEEIKQKNEGQETVQPKSKPGPISSLGVNMKQAVDCDKPPLCKKLEERKRNNDGEGNAHPKRSGIPGVISSSIAKSHTSKQLQSQHFQGCETKNCQEDPTDKRTTHSAPNHHSTFETDVGKAEDKHLNDLQEKKRKTPVPNTVNVSKKGGDPLRDIREDRQDRGSTSKSAEHNTSAELNMSTNTRLRVIGSPSYFNAMDMALKMSDQEFKAFVISQFAAIRTLISRHIQKQKPSRQTSDIALSDTEGDDSDPLLDLPALTFEQWMNFEEKLKDDNYAKIVRASLRTIKGDDYADFVRNVMSRVMANSVAELFSWRGAKGKKALTNYLFHTQLLRIVHGKKHFKKIPDKDICFIAGRKLKQIQNADTPRRSPRLSARKKPAESDPEATTMPTPNKKQKLKRDLFREASTVQNTSGSGASNSRAQKHLPSGSGTKKQLFVPNHSSSDESDSSIFITQNCSIQSGADGYSTNEASGSEGDILQD